MSEDSSSPTEAAIADRRLKVLMNKHDMSIAEIKRTEQRYASQEQHENRQKTPARRKRTRTTVQWKQPHSAVRSNRIFALVAMLGFVAALGFWITLTGVDGNKVPMPEILQTRPLQKPLQAGTSSLTTRLNKTSVIEGESIVLHINGTAISAMPDTSSLWQDFKIIATEVTEGPNAQDFRIQMLLQPRRTGTLMIPSFRVDEVRSELIIVEVLKRN